MSKKSTNYELLRILLTLFIPIYHWFLYNGIFYVSDEPNAVSSLFLFTGIPFTCLYAFMTMSSYFMLEKKYSWSFKKVYSFLALIITLYIFKTILINCLFQGYYMNYYIDTFFLKGAWWYVYPYILIMIFYPILNYIIYHLPLKMLYLCTSLFGIWFITNSVINNTMMLNDCVMFLFIYFLMGCAKRRKESCKPLAFYQKHKKQILIGLYVICIVIHTALSLYFNSSSNHFDLETSTLLLQKVHGRYNIFGLCGGIALFTYFKDIEVPYKPIIHKISKVTLFVFLLHESVMSVFWYFEIKSAEYLTYLPAVEFWTWLILYMVLCIVFATIMYKLYYTFVAPLWDKLITPLSNSKFSKKIEKMYDTLGEK